MSTEHGPHDPTVFHLHDALEQDHRLADLLDALRSPASPAELAAESSVLDQMVTVLAPAPVAKERRPMKSHLVRTIAFATAGVLSVGGVAAAATGTNPLAPILSESDSPVLAEPVATTSTTSTTSSTAAPTTTGVTTSTVAGAVPVVSVPEDACPKNHGQRVSAVAKDRSLDDGRPHGERVSEVARDKDGTTAKVTTTTAAAGTAVTTTTAATAGATATAACEEPETDDDDAVQAGAVSTTTKVDDDRDDEDDRDEDHDEDRDEVRASTTTKVSRSGASESSGKGGRDR